MPDPITFISISSLIGKATISKITGICIDLIIKQFSKTEYKKYEKNVNPVFYRAFKNTSKRILPAIKEKQEKDIFENLYTLNDLEISIDFGINDIAVTNIPDDFIDILLKKFTSSIKIKYDFDLSEKRVLTWKNIFIEEYKSTLFDFIKNNQYFNYLAYTVLNLNLDQVKDVHTWVSTLESTVKKIDEKTDLLPTMAANISGIKDLLHSQTRFVPHSEHDIENEKEGILKELQELIDKYEYSACITLIEMKIDKEWSEFDSKFKAEIFNKKGVCYLNLCELSKARSCFDTAINLNTFLDKAILNICSSFLQEKEFDKIDEYLDKFKNKNSNFYHQIT